MAYFFKNGFERTFGTWPLRGNVLENSLLEAIKIGYKSFDTAQMYKNENEIGEIFSKNGINRKDFSITSKVSESNYSKSLFLKSVEKSLKDLRTDYIDVLLLHWPEKDGNNEEALEELQKAYYKGMAKNIGVSNFTIKMMEDAVNKLAIMPVTNQVEFHPLINVSKLLKSSKNLGLPLSSYCPLARGKVFQNEKLISISKRFDKTPGQISLRWIIEKKVSINTMSTNFQNIKDNFNIYDFFLPDEDILEIDECMNENFRIVDKNIKPNAPNWD